MNRNAIKFKRQAVIFDPEDKQKFSKQSNLRRKIKQKLDITKYYQEQLDITTTPNSKGYINTLCPFHKDTSPSLSIDTNTGNCTCRGACGEKWSIFKFDQKKNNYKTIEEATRDLAQLAGISIRKKVVARYNYVSEKREIQYQVRRYDNKDFRVYQKTPDGKYKPGLKGVSRVPYNLPDVSDSSLIYICEGEKDADNLAEKFGVASTTLFGSNWSDDYSKWFEGKVIRILPDNDEAGIAYAQKVAIGLVNTAKSLKIVKLPALDIKGDVSPYYTIEWSEIENDPPQVESKSNKKSKKDQLISFWSALARVQDQEYWMGRLYGIKALKLSESQVKNIIWLVVDVRNDLMHFIPKSYGISTDDLKAAFVDIIEVIEFLAFKSNPYLFSFKPEVEKPLKDAINSFRQKINT
jgi:hypothetical protein